ncbi:MAG: alanine--glyoxylate aminotransferase family protein [Bryobacteraceae bacterium]|nr:alanine--glyoxylate aminotransferase family protein [Bryobacteraceae bacterium]
MAISQLSPPQRFLFGPGPSQVDPRVYAAMAKPIVGHLDPYFFQINMEAREVLKRLYGTANDFTLAISATGSGGMETCIANFVEPGSKFVVFTSGYFADRMAEMGHRQGATVVRFDKAWGEAYTDAEAREFILRERPQVVGFVHAETSTGIHQRPSAICAAAREVGALVIADCVTSLGAMPIELDKNGIDIAYSCSQKGLSCPPGLSPITVSPRAMEWLKSRTSQAATWYFDLKLLAEYFDGAHRYHHTAPISMFYALREALSTIEDEGIAQRFERHRINHLAFVAAMDAMGLEMNVANAADRLWTLNTVKVPAGVDDLKVRQYLMAKYGIEIGGGFGPLAGKIFRIGLMGVLSTEPDVLFLLPALEEALRENGYAAPAGAGVAAARAMYASLVGVSV